jgi:outer membrane biosynthesis protein TonB
MQKIFVVCLILTGTIGFSMGQDSSGVAPAPPVIEEPVLDNADSAEPVDAPTLGEPVTPEVVKELIVPVEPVHMAVPEEPPAAEPVIEDENKKEKKVKEKKPAKEKKVKEEKPAKEKKVKEEKPAKEKKVKEEKSPKEPNDPKSDKMTDNIVKSVGVALIGVAMWLFFSPAK